MKLWPTDLRNDKKPEAARELSDDPIDFTYVVKAATEAGKA